MLRRRWMAAATAAFVAIAAVPAAADETVQLGGASGVLIRPAGKARGSIILLAGGDGMLNVGANGSFTGLRGNQLVRTRQSYVSAGFAVLLPDRGADLGTAVQTMAAIARPVTMVGTSRGTQRAAEAIAAGVRPDKLVLTSGFLTPESGPGPNVSQILGSAGSLPRTLVVHHRHDGCRYTQPAGVEPFRAWAAGRVRVTWLDGGTDGGDPCQAAGHHGFAGLDGQVVSAVVGFAGR